MDNLSNLGFLAGWWISVWQEYPEKLPLYRQQYCRLWGGLLTDRKDILDSRLLWILHSVPVKIILRCSLYWNIVYIFWCHEADIKQWLIFVSNNEIIEVKPSQLYAEFTHIYSVLNKPAFQLGLIVGSSPGGLRWRQVARSDIVINLTMSGGPRSLTYSRWSTLTIRHKYTSGRCRSPHTSIFSLSQVTADSYMEYAFLWQRFVLRKACYFEMFSKLNCPVRQMRKSDLCPWCRSSQHYACLFLGSIFTGRLNVNLCQWYPEWDSLTSFQKKAVENKWKRRCGKCTVSILSGSDVHVNSSVITLDKY